MILFKKAIGIILIVSMGILSVLIPSQKGLTFIDLIFNYLIAFILILGLYFGVNLHNSKNK